MNQYVVIVFNRYDEESVDAVLGPYESLKAAHSAIRELPGEGYRHISTQKLVKELPEWAR